MTALDRCRKLKLGHFRPVFRVKSSSAIARAQTLLARGDLMSVDAATVRRIAHLARIAVEESEPLRGGSIRHE